jgi:hypothetical protein
MKYLIHTNLLTDFITSQTDFSASVTELAEKVGIIAENPEK